MSVELNPHVQLGFPRPLTQLVKRTLVVSNPNAQPVAFKVKTTAPKQYCVRPNSGRIEPGQKVEVAVLLQPMKEEPPMSAKCRDKFLVQSTIVTPDREDVPIQNLWAMLEKDDKKSIHEQKIRCAFLPPQSAPVPEEDGIDAAGASFNADEKYATVRSAPNAINDDSPSPPPYGSSPSSPTANGSSAIPGPKEAANGSMSEKAKDAEVFAAATSSVAGAQASDSGSRDVNGLPSSSTPSGSRRSLEEAEAEIARLQAQLDAANTSLSTLRQRKPASDDAKAVPVSAAQPAQQMLHQAAPAEGVPVHIVAGIAFGVFVFTYLFF